MAGRTYKEQGPQKGTKLPILVKPWYTRMYRWEPPEAELWSRVKLASTQGKYNQPCTTEEIAAPPNDQQNHEYDRTETEQQLCIYATDHSKQHHH